MLLVSRHYFCYDWHRADVEVLDRCARRFLDNRQPSFWCSAGREGGHRPAKICWASYSYVRLLRFWLINMAASAEVWQPINPACAENGRVYCQERVLKDIWCSTRDIEIWLRKGSVNSLCGGSNISIFSDVYRWLYASAEGLPQPEAFGERCWQVLTLLNAWVGITMRAINKQILYADLYGDGVSGNGNEKFIASTCNDSIHSQNGLVIMQ